MPRKLDESYNNEWAVGMCSAPCEAPGTFLFSCFCCPCQAYSHRTTLLDNNYDNYHCCGGLWGASCTNCCDSCTRPCPQLCLCLEVCFCLNCAVSGNRYMIQDRFRLMNTPCDNCLLWFTCLLSWAITILRCFIDIPQEVENIVDLIYYTVLGCMQTQHDIELKRQGLKQ